MNNIRQGETFDFDFELTGTSPTAFTVTYTVMKHPGDTPSITGTMSVSGGKYIGVLTALQTAALAVGQWFIYITAIDSDEEIHDPLKLYISKGWD